MRTHGAAGYSQIASCIVVVAIATVDVSGARKLAVGHGRSARRDWLASQAWHIAPQARRQIPGPCHGMKRRAELELQAGVEAVGAASLECSLRIAPVADAHHAEIGGLRLIGAVGMTLKANLVFVAALEYVGIDCGLPFYALAMSRSPGAAAPMCCWRSGSYGSLRKRRGGACHARFLEAGAAWKSDTPTRRGPRA